MILKLLEILAPLFVKIFMKLFENDEVNTERRIAFENFVKAMMNSPNQSKKSRDSYERQLARLKNESNS